MGIADIGFSAVRSLNAIDIWIANINANMGGAARVGFKQSNTKFQGAGIASPSPTTAPFQGFSVAEQSMGIAQTSIDFSPGVVVVSNEITHFAIDRIRDYFFLVDRRLSGTTTVNNNPNDYSTLLVTRDGEFHWGPLEADGFHYLLDSYGNYVVNANPANNFKNGATSAELVRATTAQMNSLTFLTSTSSVTPGLVQVTTPQFMEYSEFGASHFDLPPDPNNVVGISATAPIDGNTTGVLKQYALEGSNASLTRAIPELSLAQKLYSAISKIMSVFTSTIDDTLQLLR
jgi:flagellar basal body rod protein FlgG